MADCCQELQREVTLLRQEIAGLQRIDENKIIRESVRQSVQTLDPKIIAFGAVATGAAGIAGQALSLARLIASGLAALRAVIAGIAAALASVEVLIAGIVAAVAAIGYLIITVNQLKGDVGNLKSDVRTLNRQVQQVNHTANKALDTAYKADYKADKAQYTADTAHKLANAAYESVKNAFKDIDKLYNAVNIINQTIYEIKVVVTLAIEKANLALSTLANVISDLENEFSNIYGKLGQLESGVRIAQGTAQFSKEIAEAATQEAKQAIKEANLAAGLANLSIGASEQAKRDANNAVNRANLATNTANNAAQESAKAKQEAINAIGLANLANANINNLLGNLNQTNNQITSNRNLANNIVKQFNNALPTSIEQSIANNKALFDRIAQQNNEALRSRFNDVIAQNKAEIDRIYNSTIPQTRSNTDRIANLEAKTNNFTANPANTLSPAISTRIDNLERTSKEQERVNQQGIDLLKDIKSALPNIPAAAAAVIIPAIPNPTTIQSATRTAICDSTKPGGCLGNPLNNLRNGQSNLADKLNLGIQGLQGAALQRIEATTSIINRKLGAEIPGFGIGGKLSNFINWAFADRVMTMITMLAAVHNVFQLSTQIQQTFFSSIDNILNIGALIGNPDGTGSIDSKQYVGESLDKFFSGIFGATEWTAVKAQWKAYSTIASTSAQAFNNLREIHNDSQELLNLVRSDTAELGNALVDEGLIGEDNWEYKDPKKKIKSKALGRLQRMGQGLEALDNKLEAIEQVTSTLLNIANTAKEIKDNTEEINKAFTEANKAAQLDRNAKIEGVELPNFSLEDLF